MYGGGCGPRAVEAREKMEGHQGKIGGHRGWETLIVRRLEVRNMQICVKRKGKSDGSRQGRCKELGTYTYTLRGVKFRTQEPTHPLHPSPLRLLPIPPYPANWRVCVDYSNKV